MLTSCYLRTIPHRLAGHAVYAAARREGGWSCATCSDRTRHKAFIERYPDARFVEDGKEVFYDKEGRRLS